MDINPVFRQTIMDGLYAAANDAGWHLGGRIQGLPDPRLRQDGYGREGARPHDQSWYVVLAPCPNPKYVVAVTDEQGGFGAQTAAPDARRILAALFGIKNQENKIVEGVEQDPVGVGSLG